MAAFAAFALPAKAAPQAQWTFAIYMCSDNDLDEWGALNVEWLMSAPASEDVNFLVLWDTATGPARLYKVSHGEMTELTGFPELTPYGGGWCGNDVFATALTERHRALAREYTQGMGDRLRQEGYRGYFELDVLADMGTGELYLGELNPRVTGASSMTNVTAVAYGDMPLFLFHLLVFAGVDYEIDVQALNDGWSYPGAVDEWSQFILKQTDETVEQMLAMILLAYPPPGGWGGVNIM